MTEEEFERIYGRKPYKKVVRRKIYWGRIFAALIILILIIFLLVKAVSGLVSLFKGKTEVSDKPDNGTAKMVLAETKTPNSGEEEAPQELEKPENKITDGGFSVCIDPGHGGNDGGSTDNSGARLEKTDCIAISTRVQERLEQMGVKVIMTRQEDETVNLDERCEIANSSDADLFVSIHRNSFDGDIAGVETWVNNAEPEYDIKLAENILAGIEKVGVTENRGVHYGYIGDSDINYYVNTDTVMPSCLVEMGFLTSDEDNELFDQKLDEYADAIADGIVKTAFDIGLIDENGNRLISGRLLSPEKYINSAEAASQKQEKTTPEEYAQGVEGEEIYNTQENEYY